MDREPGLESFMLHRSIVNAPLTPDCQEGVRRDDKASFFSGHEII